MHFTSLLIRGHAARKALEIPASSNTHGQNVLPFVTLHIYSWTFLFMTHASTPVVLKLKFFAIIISILLVRIIQPINANDMHGRLLHDQKGDELSL